MDRKTSDYPHDSTVAMVIGGFTILTFIVIFWKTATYEGVSKLKDILECVYYIFFVILTLASVAFAAWQYKRSNTQRIIEKFDEEGIRSAFHLIESSAIKIKAYQNGSETGTTAYWRMVCEQYRLAQIGTVWLNAPCQPTELRMYLAAVTLANYFQDVASMYEYGQVVEKRTVENQCGRLLGTGWELLSEFVFVEREHSRQRVDHKRWEEFEKIGKQMQTRLARP